MTPRGPGFGNPALEQKRHCDGVAGTQAVTGSAFSLRGFNLACSSREQSVQR